MAEVVLQVHRHGEETHVAVLGPLQHTTAAQLRDQLRQIIDAATHPPRLVLNLGCCTSADAHGLLTLIATRQACESRGGTLTLADVPPLIHRQLDQNTPASPGDTLTGLAG